MSINPVSMSLTPQAMNDAGRTDENVSIGINVLSNDLGGAAKSLYSLNQSDLRVASSTGTSKLGATIKIVEGKVQYSANGTFIESLPAGQTATDTFTYAIRLADGTISTATVTVHLTGTNDGATISGTSTGGVTEDNPGTANGTLSVSDVDTGEAELRPIAAGTAGANGYGTFQVLANGQWTYTLNSSLAAVQALSEGETLSDTIEVMSEDGTDTQLITVTITGANDSPKITSAAASHSGGFTEGSGSLSTSNTITFADVDSSDTHTVSNSFVSGTITRSDGTGITVPAIPGLLEVALDQTTKSVAWRYNTSESALDFLAEGETLELTYSVVVTDSSGSAVKQDIKITIKGTNDGPLPLNVIMGTPDSDWLNGTPGPDHIIGNGGFDWIFGFGGNDIIDLSDNAGGYASGGAGDDTINGGNLTQSLNSGNWWWWGGVYNLADGGPGQDILNGGSAFAPGWVLNYLNDFEGNNTFNGGNAGDPSSYVSNSLYGGSGDDVLRGGDGTNGWVSNYLVAGSGTDVVHAGEGYACNYILMGLSAGDEVHGAGYSTHLAAYGTGNADSLVVSESGWTINGEKLLVTNVNGFSYSAGDGDDYVNISQATNILSGYGYWTHLSGGTGSDTLIGQANGSTFFHLAGANEGDVVVGSSNNWDYLYVTPDNWQIGQSGSISSDGNQVNVFGASVSNVDHVHIDVGQSGGQSVDITGDFAGTGLSHLSITSYGYYWMEESSGLSIDASGTSNLSLNVSVYNGSSNIITG